MSQVPPILVVGAGPTGLTAACELARHGARVRIIDKLPRILPYCRASALHSRSLEVMQDLGVVDEVLAAGQPVRGIREYANGELLAHVAFDEMDSPYPFTICLEQYKIEAILEGVFERLGGTVERETELMNLTDRLDGVVAELRRADGSEESVEAPWLVACDGARSTVRHLKHQQFPGETDPRQYVVADVVVDAELAQDELYNFMTDRGTLFMFPLPNRRTLVVADVADHHDGATETPTLGEVQALVDERGPAGTRLVDSRWLSYFRINYRLTRHYGHGRTFLAGDAVHIHSPVGGHGMNTGMQDAYNLAWKLALVSRGRSPLSLLDSYEKERRAVAEDVVRMTQLATERAESFRDLPEEDRLRIYFNAFTPPAEQLRMSRHREELDLDYRKSPICAEHDGAGADAPSLPGGPHAGAQALDAGPIDVDGRTTSLFEQLRGSKHALLLLAGGPRERASARRMADLAAMVSEAYADVIDVYVVVEEGSRDAQPDVAKVILDTEGDVHRRYGVGAECGYLIRPDGYVGYRSAPVTVTKLREYLDRIFSHRG